MWVTSHAFSWLQLIRFYRTGGGLSGRADQHGEDAAGGVFEPVNWVINPII